jgi:hypothetical protein
MPSEEEKLVRRIRAAIAQVNDLNVAEVQNFLAPYVESDKVRSLFEVWLMLADRATEASGIDKLAANLAVLAFGQQLEQMLTEKGGFLDVGATGMD